MPGNTNAEERPYLLDHWASMRPQRNAGEYHRKMRRHLGVRVLQ